VEYCRTCGAVKEEDPRSKSNDVVGGIAGATMALAVVGEILTGIFAWPVAVIAAGAGAVIGAEALNSGRIRCPNGCDNYGGD
jgi:hypothetical protein